MPSPSCSSVLGREGGGGKTPAKVTVSIRLLVEIYSAFHLLMSSCLTGGLYRQPLPTILNLQFCGSSVKRK